jgi:hypothetical protein
VWCGQLEFDPEILMLPASLLFEHRELNQLHLQAAHMNGEDLSQYSNYIHGIHSLSLIRENIRQKKPQILAGLLYNFANFSATDPRDKVFALIGLSVDVDPEFIDYGLNVSEVLNRTTRLLIGDDVLVALNWLSYIGGHNRGDLPSWVPDWSLPRSQQSPLLARYPGFVPPVNLLQPLPEVSVPSHGVS